MHVIDATMFWSRQGGGVRQYLKAKHGFLTREGAIRHTLVTPGGLTPRQPRVPGVALPFSRGYRMALGRKSARDVLVDLCPDLIEAGDPYQLAWAALDAGAARGVPTVAFYHSDLPRMAEGLFGRAGRAAATAYARRLYRRFDLVLAPSHSALAALEALGVKALGLQALGVDTRAFHPARRDMRWRVRHGFMPGEKLLLYTGRYGPEKNLPVLCETARRLGPEFTFVTLGAGPTPPRGSQVRDLGYAGNRIALIEALASVDLFVHAGDQETFGLAALEALACGVPVVASAHGALGELIDDKVGATVAHATPDAWAEAVRATLERDRNTLSRAARQRALAYDWERVLPGLLGHYRKLM